MTVIYKYNQLKGNYYHSPDKSITKRLNSSSYKEYGINAGISLTYYISAASTAISTGVRFQEFTADYESASGSASDNIGKFWGATLSATYSFSI